MGKDEMQMVQIKRVYDAAGPEDGRRVLVDRLWPRGLSREEAQLDGWLKEVAPSDELRRWFGHDPERWETFQRRYRSELEALGAVLDELCETARRETLTLLYAAKDEAHNNAVVLKAFIEARMATRQEQHR